MPKTALFVVDVQVELADDAKNQVPHASRIREAAIAILAKARSRIDGARENNESVPLTIIFVQHEESPEDGALVRGSKLWELVFHPRKGDDTERVVAKSVCKASFPPTRFGT
jgi:nicotinamidase-related amidase